MEIEASDLFHFELEEKSYDAGDFIYDFVNNATWWIAGAIDNLIRHSKNTANAKDTLNRIQNDFDPQPYLEYAFQNKDRVIKEVKDRFIKELIEPMQEQIQEVRSNKENKEKQLQDAQARRDEFSNKIEVVDKQLKSIAEFNDDLDILIITEILLL